MRTANVAAAVVVEAVVGGSAAGEVEALAQAVGLLAPIGFAAHIEGYQVKALGQARAIGEGADAVGHSSVDFAEDLLDGLG